MHASLPLYRRSLTGGLLAVFAWLALLVAPVVAQAMTQIDTGVPGAVICSAGKSAGKDGGKLAAPHCQLCTLAQQAVDTPSAAPDDFRFVAVAAALTIRATDTPPSRAPPRAHPPRAPPFS